MVDQRTSGTQRSPKPQKLMMLGATGTIGLATLRALLERGHQVSCFVRRPSSANDRARAALETIEAHENADIRFGDVTDPQSLMHDGFQDDRFDALISCMASRTGAPKDAWAIDHRAHMHALKAAREAGVSHMVLLSAICVQKPRLEFQKAKLAFENALIASGLTYSIIRPTAFFKSLSGQVERVNKGKPFLVFGDGRLTACKPISDNDLANYIADCLDHEQFRNRLLPIGGPGDAITPLEQGDALFRLLDKKPRFKHVPLRLLDTVIWGLSAVGRFSATAADKAELARIGRYYASESMLVLDPSTGRYDAASTPSTGSDTLFDFYEQLIKGHQSVERGDHAVF